MDHTDDLEPQEVKNSDILYMEIPIGMLKTRKAPGMDNLQLELFKNVQKDLRVKILQLIQKIWKSKGFEYPSKACMPSNKGLIYPILKKSSMYKCMKYRAIALLSIAYKIMVGYI